MGKVGIDTSISLDGSITGPSRRKDQPLGEGGVARLFDGVGSTPSRFHCTRVVQGNGVTHLTYTKEAEG